MQRSLEQSREREAHVQHAMHKQRNETRVQIDTRDQQIVKLQRQLSVFCPSSKGPFTSDYQGVNTYTLALACTSLQHVLLTVFSLLTAPLGERITSPQSAWIIATRVCSRV